MSSSYDDMFRNHFGGLGRVSVSRSRFGTSVYVNNDVVRTSTLLDDVSMTINGHQYSLDDPNAVVHMSESDREFFWLSCSDKGKDSDIFRAYVARILLQVGILPERITNPELRIFVINHAKKVAELGDACVKAKHPNWLDDLMALPVSTFKILMNKSSDIQRILACLRNFTDPFSFSSLIKINPEYLSVILERSHEAEALLDALKKISYPKPLLNLLSVPVSVLSHVLENRYVFIALMEYLVKQESNPFKTLTSIHSDKLTKLFANRYESIALMDCFIENGYSNPLDTLLNLKHPAFILLCSKKNEVVKIINELHSSGKKIRSITYWRWVILL